jgi:hypothetical protein
MLDEFGEAMKAPKLLRSVRFSEGVLASTGAFLLLAGCQAPQSHFDGSAIDIRFTGADSIAEMREQFFAVIAHTHRYKDPSDGFCIYQVTNGPSEFAFVQVGNWPRGFGAFNLYCYERVAPTNWVLRGLAPVNDYYHTNGTSQAVSFTNEGEYVKVIHRGDVVFTVTSRSKQSGPAR